MNRPLWIGALIVAASGAAASSALATITTCTQKAVFTQRWLGLQNKFTYNYTIDWLSDKDPVTQIDISFVSPANINLGSYAGPGSAGWAGNPPPTSPLKIRAPLIPGFFTPPVNASIMSVNNPNVVEGKQLVTLNKGLNSKQTQLLPNLASVTTGATTNSSTVAFAPGIFTSYLDPMQSVHTVDLFQDTTAAGFDVHLGYTDFTDPNSVIGVSLNRPLLNPATTDFGTLYIGIDGVIVAQVPTPGAGALLAVGGVVMMRRRRR